MNSFKIKKGDTVRVMSGKDSGKTGKVLRVIFATDRASVEGVNLYKKHVRPRRENEKGQVVEVARPIHISNLKIVCPSCGVASRIGMKQDGKTKQRVCKKCNSTL